MLLRNASVLPAFTLTISLLASDAHPIAVTVDPPQELRAIVIRSGDRTEAVTIRNGRLSVHPDLPLPWSLGMSRFEAAPYTADDLEQRRPWAIRELGAIEGRVQRPSPGRAETFVWLLQSGNAEVMERETVVNGDGAFRLLVPAGTYHGALLGTSSATRIRSGMIVKPGVTTDLGALPADRAVPVTVRVLDARTGKPIAGARVLWDPPGDILNPAAIRKLYARRWSGVTRNDGIAEIPAVGPLPHSVRWRIEAGDYAPASSVRMQLKEVRRAVLPDVRLRQRPAIVARVQYPDRGEEELEKCSLVAGEIRDPHSTVFVPVSRARLREGDSRIEFTSYGRKRVWIENRAGKTIFYRDVELADETTLVDLALRPLEIHGRVSHRGKAVTDALVTLADPHNGRLILAQQAADQNGDYRLTTWQSGKLHLYTIALGARAGKSYGNASARVDTGGRTELEVDLTIPAAGFSILVVDAGTGAPLQARVDMRSRFDGGGGRMGMRETDDQGRLEVLGQPEGTARLHIVAKGYRAADIDVAISPEASAKTVRMERGAAVSGKVVNLHGAPIAGARVLGGYPDEHDPQCFYRATTDAQGRFEFDTPPSPDTLFYVVAAGHALGITTLRPDQSATVVLRPPSSSVVSLRENNQPPESVFLVMAAMPGQPFIPLGALEELAELSGMDLYQLCGSSVDGDVVLPEFLPPGTFELYLARRGGKSFQYQRIGTIATPLARNTVLAIAPATRSN